MKLNVKLFIVLLVLCFLLLLTPYLYRGKYVSGSLIGDESYYYLRIAEDKSFFYDSLSYGGVPVVTELGWPLLLSLSPAYLSWFLPIALGLLSFALFYFLMGRFNARVQVVSSLLFIISPAFLYIFTVSSKYSGALFLTLLGLYLLLDDRKYGWIVLGLVPLFSVGMFVFNCLIGLFFLKRRSIGYSFLLGLILTVVQFWRVFSVWYYSFDLNYNLLVDFGALFGLSFFILVLGLVGVYYSKKYWVYLVMLIGIILCGYFNFLILYLNLVLVGFSGYALVRLFKLKWSSEFMKGCVFLVLVCALMFSSVAYMNNYVDSYPSYSVLRGMSFLDGREGLVFSDVSRGHWITYAGGESFVDKPFVSDYGHRKYVANRLLFSKDYSDFVGLIKEEGIKYFWVDKEMKDKVFGGEEEGMLFWLKYGSDFRMVFKKGSVEIWQFNG